MTAQMRATPGGADLCTGGTASANADGGGGYTAAQAFDNSDSTFWYVAPPAGAWLQYTFASAVSVREIYIRAGDAQRYWCPQQIVLQYYDGSTWVTVYTSPVYAESDWGSTPWIKTLAIP